MGRQDFLVLLRKLIKYIRIKVKKKGLYAIQIHKMFFLDDFVCLTPFIYLSSVLLFASMFLDLLMLRSHSPSSVSFHRVTQLYDT